VQRRLVPVIAVLGPVSNPLRGGGPRADANKHPRTSQLVVHKPLEMWSVPDSACRWRNACGFGDDGGLGTVDHTGEVSLTRLWFDRTVMRSDHFDSCRMPASACRTVAARVSGGSRTTGPWGLPRVIPDRPDRTIPIGEHCREQAYVPAEQPPP